MKEPTKKGARAEATRHSILKAAGELFASKGYNAITMREIAKVAGCSHTAIYMYFKDKEALLHHLVMPSLEELYVRMQSRLQATGGDRQASLQEASVEWVTFCLDYRSMAPIIIGVKSVRVDEEEPELPINRLRNELFGALRRLLEACLPASLTSAETLACSRMLFYSLFGAISTYLDSEESTVELMGRLRPIIADHIAVMLIGMEEFYGRNKGKEDKR